MIVVEHDQDFLQEHPKKDLAANFRTMAVRECGYTLCLDVCKAADSLKTDNEITSQLRTRAIRIPEHLMKGVLRHPTRRSIHNLKGAYISARYITNLLMLCHDLNYMDTDSFLKLNSKVNIFCAKMNKFIRFSARKVIRKK